MQTECEKLAIVYDEHSEKNIIRSRRALGQLEFPSKLDDDIMQIKIEEAAIDKEKEKPAELIKTEA